VHNRAGRFLVASSLGDGPVTGLSVTSRGGASLVKFAQSLDNAKVAAANRSWDPGRLIHRQTYIDLIDAYLADYGTRRDLARALGVSEVYVSYLLKPLSLAAGRPPAHWSGLLSAAGYEVAEALKFAKTPSQARAGRSPRHSGRTPTAATSCSSTSAGLARPPRPRAPACCR
jgi:hypothetical protein